MRAADPAKSGTLTQGIEEVAAMNSFSRSTTAERVGWWLGRAWQGLLRQETRAIQWTISQGVSPSLARPLRWVVKFAIVGLLLYVAFWLALVLVFALVVAALANNREQPVWRTTERTDHRKNSFYDPIAYSDDPDPRFDDE
jgi:hypothetical protein